MKPAPPVIMIFFTSFRGSNFVVPVSTGASFQRALLSKKPDPCPLVLVSFIAVAPVVGRRYSGLVQMVPVSRPLVR